MKRNDALIFCSIVFVTLLPTSLLAKNSDKDNCMKTKQKIEKIHSKMRQKYTNKQGEKYRKKLDKLYKDEFKYCF